MPVPGGADRPTASSRQRLERIAMETPSPYPVDLSIDYPDHPLNRITTAFRIFTVIPIAIVLALLSGGSSSQAQSGASYAATGGGIVFAATVLMLLFRQKYPRWWFDWSV